MKSSRLCLAISVWLMATTINAEVVGREAWGARPPRADVSTYEHYGLARPAYTIIVLHVTSMGRGTGVREMQRIQDYHMDERGFSDIGYNFLIDSDGTTFEGRLLDYVPSHAGRSVEADAAHDITRDPDYGAIGVVFSAETDETLTEAQVASAIALIDQLKHDHPVEAVITHTEVKARLLARGLTPVRKFEPERCPGPGSIAEIIRIRRAVDPSFDPVAYRRLFSDGAATKAE